MATLKQNNVTFTLNADVVSPFGGKYTNDTNYDGSTGLYNVNQTKLNNAGVGKSVNAVEIDWNSGKVSAATAKDITTSITTTGELLGVIKKLNDRIDTLETAFSTLATNVGQLVTITNG